MDAVNLLLSFQVLFKFLRLLCNLKYLKYRLDTIKYYGMINNILGFYIYLVVKKLFASYSW